jgi:magnesium-transporting ATPase (P-type)
MATSNRPAPVETGAPRAWHALTDEQVLAALDSGATGLSQNEASARLARVGPNTLPPPRRLGPLVRFALQFHNVLIYVLIASGTATALLGHVVDSAVIFGVIVINAVIGFIQEGKAEAAIESIRRMLSLSAMVLRDGHRREIPAEELVPGDIVQIASGDRVPADLRLLAVRNLRIDESALTGESEPVEKAVAAVAAQAPIGDRACMAWSGTLVSFGQGTGVIAATGGATELGRISRLIEQVETLTTPLLRQMAAFGRWLSAAILLLAAAVFAYGVLVQGFAAGEMLLAAVGLAVAAIPEGLPAVMTITLAIGVQRMARRNAIVRRLPAVETLGAVTVICTDKTGTLTKNEMTVTRVLLADREIEVAGVGYAPRGGFALEGRDIAAAEDPVLTELALAGLLCNDARLRREGEEWHVEGDPTEGALITFALKAGLDPRLERERLPRSDVIPFESEHRFMAVLVHDHAGHGRILVKGAIEQVLDMCASQRQAGAVAPLDRAAWHARMEVLAARGMRVLALASRTAQTGRRELAFEDVRGDLCLLGLVGIIDPPRPEAIAAVRRCHDAGIRVKMITGDHAITARAIGTELGLAAGPALSGEKLEAMDEAQLRRAVRECNVFARASPEHKLRLVEALQAEGQITAMTGDGVNDAPALKRADVGVAMGRKGTEAAKEAAQMVLADDNFASIAHAVEEGRTVYDNLTKALIFILPTNGGQALVIVAAIALGLTLPITAVQILWINMVTAVTLALALAFEPPESDAMRRPPRDPRAPLLSRFLVWRVAFVSLLMVAAALGVFLYESGRGHSIEAARTAAVNALVATEICYVFSSRFLVAPVLSLRGFFGNRVVWLTVGVLVLLQLLFTHWAPMHRLFGTAHIELRTWLLVLGIGAAAFLLVEAEKALISGVVERRRRSAARG